MHEGKSSRSSFCQQFSTCTANASGRIIRAGPHPIRNRVSRLVRQEIQDRPRIVNVDPPEFVPVVIRSHVVEHIRQTRSLKQTVHFFLREPKARVELQVEQRIHADIVQRGKNALTRYAQNARQERAFQMRVVFQA